MGTANPFSFNLIYIKSSFVHGASNVGGVAGVAQANCSFNYCFNIGPGDNQTLVTKGTYKVGGKKKKIQKKNDIKFQF